MTNIYKIFDRDENYIKNVTGFDQIYKGTVTGETTLEFKTEDSEIELSHRIIYQTKNNKLKEFIVTEPVSEHKENGEIFYEVFARDSFHETNGDWIDDKRPSGTATNALASALESTRWEVGQVDELGLQSLNYYRETVKDAIVKKLIPAYKCELETEVILEEGVISRRLIHLREKLGSYQGKRFVYDKDLISIRRTINDDGFCTALYGFGKGEQIEETGGYGRRINFADINNGRAYLENQEATAIWGRNSQSGKKPIFDKVEFDDVTDRNLLKALTQAELDKRSTPNITYECKAKDLGVDFERVELGDTVIVRDKDLNDLTITARVVEYRELDDGEIEVTLGNGKNLITDTINEGNEHISNFRSKSGVWDRADSFNQDGSLNADLLTNLVAELNSKMNGQGGYVYISEDGQGLTTYNKPLDQNPTMAIQLLGGGFRIANSKLANGEWNWKAFGDGNGFVADYIVAGILMGGLVRFNLTDGTLLIGSSTTNYRMHFDGTNLKLNNGDITLSPTATTIKSKLIKLAGDTQIDGSFTVPSANIGNLTAGHITTGTLTVNSSGTHTGSLNNSSATLGGSYKSANITGSSTSFNANSSLIEFIYGSAPRIRVSGRVDAQPSGNHHSLELNGLSINNGGGTFKRTSSSVYTLYASGTLDIDARTVRINGKEIYDNGNGGWASR